MGRFRSTEKFMNLKKPSFHFPMLLVALLFLATPNISLIDLLPDFIGYLLLARALSYAADAFPYFAEAKAGFLRMMWISLAKIPATFMMLMMWGNDNAQRSIVTVFSLCFAVLDLVFLLPTLASLFEGYFYMGNRYGCESAMNVPASLGKMTREGFQKLTVAFFVAKTVMSALPELSLISVKQYSPDYVVSGSSIVWSTYYPLFAILGAVLILCFGVVWLTYAYRYFKYLHSEGELDALLQSHFEDKSEYLYEKREYARVANGLMLLIVSVGMAIDFVLDDLNILPDVISIVLFIIALQMLRPMLSRTHIASMIFGFYAVVSVFASILKVIFVNNYTFRMIETTPAAAELYTRYSIVYAVETILACLAFGSLLKILKEAFGKYAPKAFDGNEKKLSKR